MRPLQKPHTVLPAGQVVRPDILTRRMLGTAMKFGANTEIYGEGEPVEHVYEVVSGAVRTMKVLSDGRRQIVGFYFAGDIVGLGDGDEHALSAEAVVPSIIRVIKRRTLVYWAADDHQLAEELLTMAMRDVARAQHHALMLIMTAQERVHSFLVEMMQRISIGNLLRLPMARQDIADYLGLTKETISRIITGLAVASTIQRPSARIIMMRDPSALARETVAEVGISPDLSTQMVQMRV